MMHVFCFLGGFFLSRQKIQSSEVEVTISEF